MAHLTAPELLDLLVDGDSWESWDVSPIKVAADPEYALELSRAQEKTGLDEAVLTGVATIGGHRTAILVCEFRFLGGSIGVAAGERLIAAIQRATRERLPLLALPTSGGTRMQEGTTAFLQMVKIAAAVIKHKEAHLLYLVYLRSPTTGGVFASWGSLGHLSIAEPGALIGFLGPRVFEALYNSPFPPGVQTAENLHAHGLIDAVLPPEQLAEFVDRALRLATSTRACRTSGNDAPASESLPDVPAWDSVLASRREDRPGVREVMLHSASEVLPLHGTGQGEVDPGLILALVRFGHMPCVLLGHDRRGQMTRSPLGPGALRQARRGMRLAAELNLPLVTVIDTAGAALSKEAEEGGLAGEIARCIADMLSLHVPTVSLLLGQGAGGGALALIPADRVLAAQHGWLAPLPPEGASAILHHDIDHAPDMAARQGIRSSDLLATGIVDEVIPEFPDAAEESAAFCTRVGAVLHRKLSLLEASDTTQRLSDRAAKFNRIGLLHNQHTRDRGQLTVRLAPAGGTLRQD